MQRVRHTKKSNQLYNAEQRESRVWREMPVEGLLAEAQGWKKEG